ncbi:MAG: hypothetical protein IJ150_04955 [Bacteroidales bacterium]|nr:hypothetical protein [Bacteroidales bacterium]
MTEEEYFNKHSATQSTGFDYQLLYLIYRLLCMKEGESAGFEAKDDVHFEYSDGIVELCQVKHSNNGNILTDSADDLWKTLSIWAEFLNTTPTPNKYKFVFVTNRPNESSFVNRILDYQQHNSKEILKLKKDVEILNAKSMANSSDDGIRKHRCDVASLNDVLFGRLFLSFSYIFIDNIEDKCKQQIASRYTFCRDDNKNIIDRTYNDLCSNILAFKNANNGKFNLTFEDYTRRFRQIFHPNIVQRKVRKLDCTLPDNIENQTFVKQLDEIDYWNNRKDDIIEYTECKLNAINNIDDWEKCGEILPTEKQICIESARKDWKNKFNSRYREFRNKEIDTNLHNLIACKIVDDVQEINRCFSIFDNVPFNNGVYWMLSDEPTIGWRRDWEKYKNEQK